MTISTYTSTDDSNYINKRLTSKGDVTNVTLKNSTDYVNPVIMLQADTIGFNYVYIPNFGRYYFVREITSLKNNLWSVALHVDVLMSFRSQLKNVRAITKRQEYLCNNDLIDDRIKLLNYPALQTNITFPNGFLDAASGNLQYVMITTGGDI